MTTTRAPEPRVSWHCEDCGSKDISAKTFNLRWDEERQLWIEPEGAADIEPWCNDCEGETAIVTRALP